LARDKNFNQLFYSKIERRGSKRKTQKKQYAIKFWSGVFVVVVGKERMSTADILTRVASF